MPISKGGVGVCMGLANRGKRQQAAICFNQLSAGQKAGYTARRVSKDSAKLVGRAAGWVVGEYLAGGGGVKGVLGGMAGVMVGSALTNIATMRSDRKERKLERVLESNKSTIRHVARGYIGLSANLAEVGIIIGAGSALTGSRYAKAPFNKTVSNVVKKGIANGVYWGAAPTMLAGLAGKRVVQGGVGAVSNLRKGTAGKWTKTKWYSYSPKPSNKGVIGLLK